MRPSGHCQRHPYLVLWEPTHGHRSRGRPKSTLDDILFRDADADSSQELEALIVSRLGCGQLSSKWRMQGRGPHPLIFRPKWGPKGRKKFFLRQPHPPPPPPFIWRSGFAPGSGNNRPDVYKMLCLGCYIRPLTSKSLQFLFLMPGWSQDRVLSFGMINS